MIDAMMDKSIKHNFTDRNVRAVGLSKYEVIFALNQEPFVYSTAQKVFKDVVPEGKQYMSTRPFFILEPADVDAIYHEINIIEMEAMLCD